jgi:uncharacterized protein YajQ (UPF0234 family)
MPSFDVVSKVALNEVENAVNQCQKEISQRYDFRGTDSRIELQPDGGIQLSSADEEHLKAAYKVLMEKLVKRGVSLRALDPQDVEPAAKQSVRQRVLLKQGISTDKGKEINRLIKDSKLKVQSQLQDEQVRVTGKNRDDLQAAIRLLRGQDLEIDLQFVNFRD